MKINVQSYNCLLNEAFVNDKIRKQNVTTYEFSEGYDKSIKQEHKAVLITVTKAEDEDMVSKLIKACFKDISNVKLIDGKVKDYSQTLNHIKNDKNSFYDNIWFQTFGLGKNGSEIQFFKFAHEDGIYQSETCWVPDESIKSLVKLNNLTK